MEFSTASVDVEVSIILTSFNHEKYLARALDSILEQAVSFRFEIVIGDDASSDKSVEVILGYVKRYPQIIVPILRSQNIGGTKNFADLFRCCRGKYITFIDGDDFWVDDKKLQTQYDFLERNPNVYAVSHKVKVCDANEVVVRISPSDKFPDGRITIYHFLKGKRFPLTATMIRALKGCELDSFLRLLESGPRNAGDTTICLFLLDKGPIPILDDAKSVYYYRATAGHGNYNSITRLPDKILDKMKFLRINNEHYAPKYFFGWLYARLIGSIVRGIIFGKGCELKHLILLLVEVTFLFCKTAFGFSFAKIKAIMANNK